jgi:hypothetical protein
MPLLEPKPLETQKDFVKRCMADTMMAREYPELDHRYAVCIAQYKHKQ